MQGLLDIAQQFGMACLDKIAAVGQGLLELAKTIIS